MNVLPGPRNSPIGLRYEKAPMVPVFMRNITLTGGVAPSPPVTRWSSRPGSRMSIRGRGGAGS
ncbi:hypothetical protein Psi02_71180 [Planotetraspora silvatica]|uniref:Uncharacterized protein n=1 Tax=Planotetraspora silvatica TaxID=234614 RepID=A0A8J3URP4_9ACTN|nr:hypothetical protein Psi02_71180 [Planotetraspora silvatica]